MHDPHVRAADHRPQFDDATCESVHLAILIAAGLDQRADLEVLPAAERQDGVPEFNRVVAKQTV